MKRSLIKSDQLSLNYLNWLGLLNQTALMAKTSISPSKLIEVIILFVHLIMDYSLMYYKQVDFIVLLI